MEKKKEGWQGGRGGRREGEGGNVDPLLDYSQSLWQRVVTLMFSIFFLPSGRCFSKNFCGKDVAIVHWQATPTSTHANTYAGSGSPVRGLTVLHRVV